jgi:anti-sigma factor RsiW
MSVNRHESNEAEAHAARLTAYALGQLDEPERAEVEAELAASDDSRQTVATLRTVAGALVEATRHDLSPGRSATLRQAVEKRLDELEAAAVSPPSQTRTTRVPWRVGGSAPRRVVGRGAGDEGGGRQGTAPQAEHVAMSPHAATTAKMSEEGEELLDMKAGPPAARAE